MNSWACVVVALIARSYGIRFTSILPEAIRSFARSWTADLKGRGIRVNVVSPGPVLTPVIDTLADNAEQFKRNMVASIPLGRWGQPDEIAKAVVFLASDDSSYVAGAELFVDGGMAQV